MREPGHFGAAIKDCQSCGPTAGFCCGQESSQSFRHGFRSSGRGVWSDGVGSVSGFVTFGRKAQSFGVPAAIRRVGSFVCLPEVRGCQPPRLAGCNAAHACLVSRVQKA